MRPPSARQHQAQFSTRICSSASLNPERTCKSDATCPPAALEQHDGICQTKAAESDLALHLVIIAADNHSRKNLLLDAVSPEPMQHRIAPRWNALQQGLHRTPEPLSQLGMLHACEPLGTGKGKGFTRTTSSTSSVPYTKTLAIALFSRRAVCAQAQQYERPDESASVLVFAHDLKVVFAVSGRLTIGIG